jgi:hypothetical protein
MAYLKFEWDHDARYRSNDGKGPLTARILCATTDEVTMERWSNEHGKRTRFTLPLKFFLSPRCGWRLTH